MIGALAALLLALPAPARAAAAAVRRGDLVVRVRVTGTVVPDDVFRLKSTIDGRVESVDTSSFAWKGADQPLATLAHKELAAMLDARGAQDQELMEDRWRRVYRPTPVRCPSTCYVLKVYTRAKAWVKPNAVLFEAARGLKMVARVRPEDVPYVRDGQELTFWPASDPKRRLTGRVARFILDVQGRDVSPGGTFTLYLSPGRYFDPGTEWEGEIVPTRKKDVLVVPTAALIRSGDALYLPVRVSTGVTTAELTQITSGVEEKREILVLDDAGLRGAERHKPEVDRAALERRRRELESAPAAETPAEPGATLTAPAAEARPAEKKEPAPLEDTGYGGEDPYGDQ